MGTAPAPHTSRVFRFAAFVVDAKTGELTNAGQRTPLRDQPLQLLLALLERPGELVMREELTRRLWPADTFVDFDRGLNKAMNHLRDALSDSADHPQFIETLPRKGYRFIAPVTRDAEEVEPGVVASPPVLSRHRRWPAIAAAFLAFVATAMAIAFAVNPGRPRRLVRRRLAPAPLLHSPALLPLANFSGNSEEAYFPAGLPDALITQLVKVPRLRTTSR